jgi:hypothetical protein
MRRHPVADAASHLNRALPCERQEPCARAVKSVRQSLMPRPNAADARAARNRICAREMLAERQWRGRLPSGVVPIAFRSPTDRLMTAPGRPGRSREGPLLSHGRPGPMPANPHPGRESAFDHEYDVIPN